MNAIRGRNLTASRPNQPAFDTVCPDRSGNVSDHAGGIWVIAPDERSPGTIPTPEIAANCGWREYGKTQHITVETAVYRIKLRMP
jgi:hypothetical protein